MKKHAFLLSVGSKLILAIVLFNLVACTSAGSEAPANITTLPTATSLTETAVPPTSVPPTPTSAPIVSNEPSHPLAGLLYQANDSLWQVAPDGSVTQLVQGLPAYGTLSPDQTKVLYDDYNDLFVYDLQTQTEQQLTNTPDIVERGYWWPNNPQTIVYNFVPQEQLGPWSGYLGLLDLNSGTMSVLEDEVGSGSASALSPDGQTLAVSLNGQMMLYDVANGRWQPLDPTTFGLTSEQITFTQPAWSPDGNKLAVISSERNPNSDFNLISTIIFDFTGQAHTRLHSYTPVGGGDWQPRAQWSSTGNWLSLLYPAETLNGGRASFWLTRADGIEKKSIAETSNLIWHPTNDQALLVNNGTDPASYRLIDAESGAETAVAIPTADATITTLFIGGWR